MRADSYNRNYGMVKMIYMYLYYIYLWELLSRQLQDLYPELQSRSTISVELDALVQMDFGAMFKETELIICS